MSGFVGNNNCQICIACFNNCTACPAHVCARRTMYFNNLDRINKQVRMDSSLSLLKRRSLNVSRQVGQSANPKMLGQAGGPGDLIHAVGKTNACDQKHCNTVTYRLPILQRRTANKGKIGVDKKHGSYARYLARRVGGEIRKEKMPVIRNRTAFIHQPRNRTGTAAACVGSRACGKFQYRPPSKFLLRARTAFKCNDICSQTYANATPPNNVRFPRWSTPGNQDPNQGPGTQALFGPAEVLGGSLYCGKMGVEFPSSTKGPGFYDSQAWNNPSVPSYGSLAPQVISGYLVRSIVYTTTTNQLFIHISGIPPKNLFTSITFVNCKTNEKRTYKSNDANFNPPPPPPPPFSGQAPFSFWRWTNSNTPVDAAFWNDAIGQSLAVYVDHNTEDTNCSACGCCTTKCCCNRIPGGPSMGKYEFKCDSTHNCSRNPQPGDVTGLLGNNTQCVPSGNCSCCPKV